MKSVCNYFQPMAGTISALIFCMGATISRGTEIVVPSDHRLVEGNANSVFFDLTYSAATDFKIQQVFAAEEFGNDVTQIRQIAFRPDGNIGAAFAPTTLRGMIIKLSTTVLVQRNVEF